MPLYHPYHHVSPASLLLHRVFTMPSTPFCRRPSTVPRAIASCQPTRVLPLLHLSPSLGMQACDAQPSQRCASARRSACLSSKPPTPSAEAGAASRAACNCCLYLFLYRAAMAKPCKVWLSCRLPLPQLAPTSPITSTRYSEPDDVFLRQWVVLECHLPLMPSFSLYFLSISHITLISYSIFVF